MFALNTKKSNLIFVDVVVVVVVVVVVATKLQRWSLSALYTKNCATVSYNNNNKNNNNIFVHEIFHFEFGSMQKVFKLRCFFVQENINIDPITTWEAKIVVAAQKN